MSAASIPAHIQKLIDERATIAAEASNLEWQAREKRVAVRQLSERIENEMRIHVRGRVDLLRYVAQPAPAEFYEPEPGKKVAAKTERQRPPVAARRGDEEKAKAIAEAVARGDWTEVARLGGAR